MYLHIVIIFWVTPFNKKQVLVFWGISIIFSVMAVAVYIPADCAAGSLFSTSSPASIVCRFFDDGHSDCCELIPHCSFDLQSETNTTLQKLKN